MLHTLLRARRPRRCKTSKTADRLPRAGRYTSKELSKATTAAVKFQRRQRVHLRDLSEIYDRSGEYTSETFPRLLSAQAAATVGLIYQDDGS